MSLQRSLGGVFALPPSPSDSVWRRSRRPNLCTNRGNGVRQRANSCSELGPENSDAEISFCDPAAAKSQTFCLTAHDMVKLETLKVLYYTKLIFLIAFCEISWSFFLLLAVIFQNSGAKLCKSLLYDVTTGHNTSLKLKIVIFLID